MAVHFNTKILEFIAKANYQILYRDDQHGIYKIDIQDGIKQLVIGVAPPLLIMEHYLFAFKKDNMDMFKKLLQKNRDMLHGAFVINEEGNKVLFRYTMQLENLDYNEFESALNSLGLLLQEYAHEIIHFSKH
jgi:hypothetical protein